MWKGARAIPVKKGTISVTIDEFLCGQGPTELTVAATGRNVHEYDISV
jgi:hypothetical protein